ncbi:MAG: class I SAM-dependent methyltransferase [Verrucomicrobia bacterium]|nr:class I SAM-dependent methyltransferase [Verrucomicrobiota bacterium]
MLPSLLFENEHLLVVNKPAGWNTHAPSPFAGEGIYDWLKHREPRWAKLAIIHRLDKETSGVIVFGKTPLANHSLTEQFASRTVQKKYLLLTDRAVDRKEFLVKSRIVRSGERYVSSAQGDLAETRFTIPATADLRKLIPDSDFGFRISDFRVEPPQVGSYTLIEASPLTGRTHQIRVHAAASGFPILGDTLYGGTAFQRVCLHAAELQVRHPASGEELVFKAPVDFSFDTRLALRQAVIEPEFTNAYRLIHGASDGWPGWYVDRLGDFLLSQAEEPLNDDRRKQLAQLLETFSLRGAYHKILSRHVRKANLAQASPQLTLGEPAPPTFLIQENDVRLELSFNEGYSVGLFLDQRDNRRRFLTGHVAANLSLFQPEVANRKSQISVLNTFAYTCGFSVCAARAGARTTSLDLSKKYLEWGKRNFALNKLNPADHDFIYGDVFDWLKRLSKKGRKFDVVVLDPPTFSRSKEHGAFRAEKDFGKLVSLALPLTKTGGVLFTSTNDAGWSAEHFVATVEASVRAGKRSIAQRYYAPQPPDFPVNRSEPAYLKTLWLRVD